MTGLDEHAESGTDIVRVSEAEGQPYRLDSYQLAEAEDIGTDEFPQYGSFVDVTALDTNGDALGPRYVEAPRSLAAELVDSGIDEGDMFVITSTDKTPDGSWSITAVRWKPQ